MDTPAAISLTDLTVQFKSWRAVDQVSLSVASGTICALVGTSGSGKTSLLKCVNGILRSSSGRVEIFGSPVPEGELSGFRRQFGYVIQSAGLFPHLTVWENVSLLGKACGHSELDRLQKAKDLLVLMRLDPKRSFEKYPRELSGGERQRVGIARALYLDPPILLMDEPFGALDPITRKHLQDETKALVQEMQKTVLMVTHDLNEAFLMSDQIAVMSYGKVLQIGSPNDIRKHPKHPFVREFVEAAY